jgi:hypothetical protein
VRAGEVTPEQAAERILAIVESEPSEAGQKMAVSNMEP